MFVFCFRSQYIVLGLNFKGKNGRTFFVIFCFFCGVFLRVFEFIVGSDLKKIFCFLFVFQPSSCCSKSPLSPSFVVSNPSLLLPLFHPIVLRGRWEMFPCFVSLPDKGGNIPQSTSKINTTVSSKNSNPKQIRFFFLRPQHSMNWNFQKTLCNRSLGQRDY